MVGSLTEMVSVLESCLHDIGGALHTGSSVLMNAQECVLNTALALCEVQG